jgi:isoleucyl-tRNA synthetase
VTEELEVEGRARDLVRSIQQARRDAGLEVSDRISLRVRGGDLWIEALERHEALIAHETLAVEVSGERDGSAAGAEPQISVTIAG